MMTNRNYLFFAAVAVVCCVAACIIHDSPSSAKDEKEQPVHQVVVPPKNYVPAQENAESEKGHALFASHNCAVCHSIGGKGGCLAPVLDGIGARRSREFILARVTDGEESIREFERLYKGHEELMPHLRVPQADARKLAAYLLTLPAPASGFRIVGHRTDAVPDAKVEATSTPLSIAKGRKLFYEKGCISCHGMGNLGGQFAPRVDGISSYRTREYIAKRINGAQLLTEDTKDEYAGKGQSMPPVNLSPQEVIEITDFLMSIPKQI